MSLINGDEAALAVFPGAVLAEACALLVGELAARGLEPGRVVAHGEAVDRFVHTAFLPRDHWAAQVVVGAAEQANDAMGWGYALTGVETLQLGVYGGGDRHGWHMDTLSHGELVRKLTVVVQLDDGADYVGGDLELLRFGSDVPSAIEVPAEAMRQRGTAIVFPSYVLHRVTPVTAGQRRTLVGWLVGPRFR
jgi:PKHD-type hydroxylase